MKPNYTLLAFIFLLCYTRMAAQSVAPDWGWAQRAGTSGNEEARHIIADSKGNTYVIATIGSASMQLGGFTLNRIPGTDFSTYVAKYSPSGTVLWAKVLQSIATISVDAADNLYVVGQYYGEMSLGGTTLSSSATVLQTYIAKFSPSGQVLWLQQKGTVYTVIRAMTRLDEENMVVTGVSWDDVVDGIPLQRKSWVGKMNTATGIISQVKELVGECMEGNCNNSLDGLYVDRNHNVYLYGAIPNNRIDANWQMQGTGKTYIAKFDNNFNFLWSRLMDSGNIFVQSIVSDSDGNVNATGFWRSTNTVTIDPANVYQVPLWGLGNMGDFLVKYSANGTLLWQNIRATVMTNLDVVRMLAADLFGNVYLAGNFNNQLTFTNETITATSGSNLFIARVGADGNYTWVRNSSGPGVGLLTGMAEDNRGSIYICGRLIFQGQVYGNTTLTIATPIPSNPYASDSYIAKLGSCDAPVPQIAAGALKICNGSAVTLHAPQGAQYLWSSGQTTQSIEVHEPGIYSVTVAGNVGCYNTSATVAVTATNIDNSITVAGSQLHASANTATHQWGTCNGVNFDPISGATFQDFTPQVNGSYAAEISSGGCTILSDCINVDTLGINPVIRNGIYLYPNPNHGVFNIVLPEGYDSVTFRVLDIAGRQVYGGHISAGSNAITETFPAGCYYIVVEAGENTQSFKMMVR